MPNGTDRQCHTAHQQGQLLDRGNCGVFSQKGRLQRLMREDFPQVPAQTALMRHHPQNSTQVGRMRWTNLYAPQIPPDATT